MIRFSALLPAAALLAACQMAAAPEDEPATGTCPAPEFQSFVGQPITAIDPESVPELHRVIGPDTAVTMDFREERMNIEHDATRIVTRIYCG